VLENSYIPIEWGIAQLLAYSPNLGPGLAVEPLPHAGHPTEAGVSSGAWFRRTLDTIRQQHATRSLHRRYVGSDVSGNGYQDPASSVSLLSIRIFADATLADNSSQKHSFKPVLCTIDNLAKSVSNKVSRT
jgi:hypothetical protein